MKRLIQRFGKLITASFIVIVVGIIAFLLTPLLLHFWGIDSDVIGLIIALTGLAVFVIGLIRRQKPHGLKLTGLVILVVVLFLPLLQLILSSVYYLIAGKPMGD